MLAGSFKSYSPSGIIKVPLFGLVLWFFALLYKTQSNTTADAVGMPIYQGIAHLIAPHFYLSAFISLLFTVCSAFWLNYIVNQHNVLSRKTYLIALFYLIFSAFSGDLLVFHPGILVNFIVIGACQELFDTYRKDSAQGETFNAGLLIGLASLLYLPALVLFFLIWITLAIFRPFIWREYLVALMGLILPWIYLVVYYFWNNKLTEFWQKVVHEHFIRKQITLPNDTLHGLFYCVFGGIIFFSLFKLVSANTALPLKSKKIMALLFWCLLLALISVTMAPVVDFPYLSFSAIPLAVFTANYFLQLKKGWMAEVLFTLMFLSVLLLHLHTYLRH
jgi:hypothetical protein